MPTRDFVQPMGFVTALELTGGGERGLVGPQQDAVVRLVEQNVVLIAVPLETDVRLQLAVDLDWAISESRSFTGSDGAQLASLKTVSKHAQAMTLRRWSTVCGRECR